MEVHFKLKEFSKIAVAIVADQRSIASEESAFKPAIGYADDNKNWSRLCGCIRPKIEMVIAEGIAKPAVNVHYTRLTVETFERPSFNRESKSKEWGGRARQRVLYGVLADPPSSASSI